MITISTITIYSWEGDIKKTIFLLDIDGTMLRSEGYHAAAQATINYFTRQMGLGDQAPGQEVRAIFEAQGITNEWDMIPIILAGMFDAMLEQEPRLNFPDSFEEACTSVAKYGLIPPRLDYPRMIQEVGRHLRTGMAPAEATLKACLDGASASLFPRLSRFPVLLSAMLENTRSMEASIISAVFENFALGDAIFVWSFGLLPVVRTPSFLKEYDQPLISIEIRDQLLDLWREKQVGMAAYTARLSLPPEGTEQEKMGYAPETELALEVLGLNGIASIGSGRMLYLCDLLGISPDLVVKPAPVQAMAAILTAAGVDEKTAIENAGAVAQRSGIFPKGSEPILPLPDLERVLGRGDQAVDCLSVHVFEDAPSGFWGAKRAVELLTGAGIPGELHCWGISENAVKQRALRENGGKVYPHFDEAFKAALEQVEMGGGEFIRKVQRDDRQGGI